MTLVIEGIELDSLRMSMEELKLELAILLYSQGRLSMGKASKMCNMNRILFLEELGKRKIPVNYGEEDLDNDLSTLGIK